MCARKPVSAQVMDHLPWHGFHRPVERYGGNRRVQPFSRSDRYRCTASARLTHRSGPRGIGTCPRAREGGLHHMGLRGGVAGNTLSDASGVRDRRLHATFTQHPIRAAGGLYHGEGHGPGPGSTVHAPGSSTAGLCLPPFPRARFRRTGAAVRPHTPPDPRGDIPASIHAAGGRLHDVSIRDIMAPEPGAFHTMDRAHPDPARLHAPHPDAAHSVLRARRNTRPRRLHPGQAGRTTGIIRDRAVAPDDVTASRDCPDRPRRIEYLDGAAERTPVFPTNGLVPPPLTVAELYRPGWRVEPFFQADQAEPGDKAVPRHSGERGEEPDPDRRLRPCAGGGHPKATRAGHGSPHSPTDPGRYPVRENTVESTAWK